MNEQEKELRDLWKEVCIASIRTGRDTCLTDANICVKEFKKAFNIN